MIFDRTIAFARSRNGEVADQNACRIRINGNHTFIRACESDIDPATFSEDACATWRCFAEDLPNIRRSQLICEVGVVQECGRSEIYSIAHANGAILERARQWLPSAHAESVRWEDLPKNLPVVLAPSATLALTDFILDAIPGVLQETDWPLGDRLIILDTACSPYPPQRHPNGAPPICIVPSSITRTVDDSITFQLLQRSERWQRPFSALYFISRRNLALSWDGTPLPLEGNAIVLDTVSAETEPTLFPSQWLGTWYLHTPANKSWGCGRLELEIDTQKALRGAAVVGCPLAACICDAIEGEIYATAPPTMIPRGLVTVKGSLP